MTEKNVFKSIISTVANSHQLHKCAGLFKFTYIHEHSIHFMERQSCLASLSDLRVTVQYCSWKHQKNQVHGNISAK